MMLTKQLLAFLTAAASLAIIPAPVIATEEGGGLRHNRRLANFIEPNENAIEGEYIVVLSDVQGGVDNTLDDIIQDVGAGAERITDAWSIRRSRGNSGFHGGAVKMTRAQVSLSNIALNDCSKLIMKVHM